MKKDFMKGFLSGAIIFSIASASVVTAVTAFTAYTATFPILIDGKKFESEKPAVVIEGSTYLPLKALGEVLGVPVSWDNENNVVNISKQIPIEYNQKIALADENGFFLGLYDGSTRNGLPEGFGSLYMYDNNIYEGMFHNGNIDGSGTLTYKSGSNIAKFSSTFLWDTENKDLLMVGPTKIYTDDYTSYCDNTWLVPKNDGPYKVVRQGIEMTLHNVDGTKSIVLTEYDDFGAKKSQSLYTFNSKIK